MERGIPVQNSRGVIEGFISLVFNVLNFLYAGGWSPQFRNIGLDQSPATSFDHVTTNYNIAYFEQVLDIV